VIRRNALPPLAVLVLSAACATVVALGTHGPVRVVLAFAFLLFCPGLAVVPLMRLRSPGFELVLSLVISIAVGIAVSEVLLLAGAWSEAGGLAILVALSVAGATAQLVLARRKPE
jgi:uncharacterized membrane protein